MQSKSKNIVIDIKNKILSNEYKEGDKLPSEATLSKMYNVSRTTIREVLHRLSDSDYIITKVGSGSYVNKKTNALPIIEVNSTHQEGTLDDIILTRKHLSSIMLKNVCNNNTSEDINYLITLLREIKSNPNNIEIATKNSLLFHYRLVLLCSNPYVKDALNNCLNDFNRVSVSIKPEIEIYYLSRIITSIVNKDLVNLISLFDVYIDHYDN